MQSDGSSKGAFELLLTSTLWIAKTIGLLADKSRVAVDATGFESRHVSRYYVWRLGGRHSARAYPKLTVACDLATHLYLGAFVCMGPCQDSPQFPPTIRQASTRQSIDEVLGDKGYDAEHNHRLCREDLAIPSTLIPVRRKSKLATDRTWPTTPYRREMKRRLRHSDFGQRWQVESSFSRNKRLLGSALRARTWPMQQWECLLRVLTHNLLLVGAA
jgi:Transposase DDE domain